MVRSTGPQRPSGGLVVVVVGGTVVVVGGSVVVVGGNVVVVVASVVVVGGSVVVVVGGSVVVVVGAVVVVVVSTTPSSTTLRSPGRSRTTLSPSAKGMVTVSDWAIA